MSVVEPDEEMKTLAALTAQLDLLEAPEEVPASARQRLLAAAEHAGRFERFVPAIAEMADVSETQARTWLDSVWGDRPCWESAAPGARAWWVQGGPKTQNALRGFVHIAAGQGFPHHKHLGAEHVLVLQGGAQVSSGERLRAGDWLNSVPGEEHDFAATPRGPDLLLFTVIFEGLDFGRFVARPRD